MKNGERGNVYESSKSSIINDFSSGIIRSNVVGGMCISNHTLTKNVNGETDQNGPSLLFRENNSSFNERIISNRRR